MTGGQLEGIDVSASGTYLRNGAVARDSSCAKLDGRKCGRSSMSVDAIIARWARMRSLPDRWHGCGRGLVSANVITAW